MPAERLYYADSSLTAFSSVVTDIRERSRTGGASLWQIALDRTAFYPTSGGQPHDTGLLQASAPSGTRIEIPIVEVDEDEQGEVWHLTPKPLVAGTAVEGRVDWPRRLDHMQQHSGQHLLSALFDHELRARTVSFHLGEATSTIDLAIESVAPPKLVHIERLANDVIAEARPMSQHTVSGEEAERVLAEGKLRKLPPRSGPIRLVSIPQLDLNACGGTHVASTSRIGALLIRGTERVRQTTRVTFVCGGRALAAAQADDAVLAELSRELSVGRGDVVSAVARIKAESRALFKEQKRLCDDLANYHAARLVVEDPLQNNLRVIIRTFPDRDAEYVKLLASRVVLAAPHTIALLASTQATPATVVAAASTDLDRDANQLLRPALTAAGGRGGGSATLAQGQVAAEKIAELFQALESELRARV
jgi:alanyl-tRNA synthetase